MAKRLPELTIIRDTREQNGWIFEPEEKVSGKPQIIGTREEKLDYGDYTIDGHINNIVIERKNGFAELFGNMLPSDHKDRFEREMERMQHVKHKYLIIETNLSMDTLTLGVPQIRHGPPCSSVLNWVNKLCLKYGIMPMFVGDCGKRVAKSIFREYVRMYNND